MATLFSASAAFTISAVAHLIVWRVHRPRHQYLTLLALTATGLGGSLALLVSIGSLRSGLWALVVPQTVADLLSFAFLYTALMFAYIATYSAVQADSPSLSILLRIASLTHGATRAQLEADLGDDVLVTPRLTDLVIGGLATYSGGRYAIAPRGAAFARVHLFYRTLLKLEKGG